MKKSLLQLGLAIILLTDLSSGAGGQQASAPAANPAEKPASESQAKAEATAPAGSPQDIVLKVGETKLTRGDIDLLISSLNPQGRQSVAVQGRRTLGNEYAKMLVLSQQALKDNLESSPTVRQNIELQRDRILAGAELEKINKEIQVSPQEVTEYYNSHPQDYERVKMRQFSARKRPPNSTDAKMGLSEEEAKAKIDAIRKAVASGGDIKKIKEQYEIPGTISIDVDPRIQRLPLPVPAMDKAAASLKDGEISQPVDLPQAIVLVQVTEHSHEDQKDVAGAIEAKLKQERYEAKVEDLKKQAGVWMDDQYFTGPTPRATVPGTVAPPTLQSPPNPPATTQSPKK